MRTVSSGLDRTRAWLALLAFLIGPAGLTATPGHPPVAVGEIVAVAGAGHDHDHPVEAGPSESRSADHNAPAGDPCPDCACPTMVGGCTVAAPAAANTWSVHPEWTVASVSDPDPAPRGRGPADLFRPPRR